MSKAKTYKAVSIVEGRGYGKAYFIGRAVQTFEIEKIGTDKILSEIERFDVIREEVKEYYRQYRSSLEDTVTEHSENSILKIYEHIIDDPAFTGQVTRYVTSDHYSLESAIRSVSKEFIDKFNSAGTSYFQDRSSDMVEICEKLVAHLAGNNAHKIELHEDVVLVINRSFTPSDLINYTIDKIKAVVSLSAGKTSHAAILARSYGIPVVSGVDELTKVITPNFPVLVDATLGSITVNPTDSDILNYEKSSSALFDEKLKGAAKWKGPVYTRDGVPISVMANISFESDIEFTQKNGADGVGLVRTEYLLSEREDFPTEDEQFEYYSNILECAGKGKETIIRVMDIGGDKAAKFLRMPKEDNPFMGWRAVRILLEKTELFETQLRAIMRAGVGKNYKVMFPMVTAQFEWKQIREFTEGVARDMGMECPPLGILFEVPLAILEMDMFLKDIEFASIGTNDLLQYLSAADRNNNKVNYLYNPAEPAFLKIIKSAIDGCKDKGIPISICGEMAGNPQFTLLLVGIGLNRFSVSPSMIPIIKEIISNVKFSEIREEVSHLISVASLEGISEWIEKSNKDVLGSIFERYQIDISLK